MVSGQLDIEKLRGRKLDFSILVNNYLVSCELRLRARLHFNSSVYSINPIFH